MCVPWTDYYLYALEIYGACISTKFSFDKCINTPKLDSRSSVTAFANFILTAQVQKRVHRFGQYHEVTIYKIICKDITQEMAVMNRQAYRTLLNATQTKTRPVC